MAFRMTRVVGPQLHKLMTASFPDVGLQAATRCITVLSQRRFPLATGQDLSHHCRRHYSNEISGVVPRKKTPARSIGSTTGQRNWILLTSVVDALRVVCPLRNFGSSPPIRQMSALVSGQTDLFSTNSSSLFTIRHKSKGSKKSRQGADESDSEDESAEAIADDDDVELEPGVKELTAHLPSLRLDTVVKSGFSLSRSNVEKIFYESRLRVNGERVLKKSIEINVGDEVDLVRCVNSQNDKFIDVMRVQIIRLRVPSDANAVATIRRYKLLTIENYKNPWSGDEYTK